MQHRGDAAFFVFLTFSITSDAFIIPDATTKTFGIGLKGYNLRHDTLVYNHTATSGSNYSYLSHFWMTYASPRGYTDNMTIGDLFFDIYVDYESQPSISFNPAYAAGDFFIAPGPWPDSPQKDGSGDREPYTAGGKMGKGALQGGWYHHHKIPFHSNIAVKTRLTNATSTFQILSWVQIRGVEGMPIILAGGVQVPASARMYLQKVDSPMKKGDKAVLAMVPNGVQALVYLVSWGNTALHNTGYIEGQFHGIINNHPTKEDDIVLGTGVEDYFQSAFRFSADFENFPPQFYTFSDCGLTYFNRTTIPGDRIEKISAYKFHDEHDLLLLSEGGKIYWEVRGDVIRMQSYVWMYTWPMKS